MLDALIPYLRSVSTSLIGEETTLGNELEAVRGYLVVMSIRLPSNSFDEFVTVYPLPVTPTRAQRGSSFVDSQLRRCRRRLYARREASTVILGNVLVTQARSSVRN